MGLFEWHPRSGEEPRTVAACEREIRRLEHERDYLRQKSRDLEQEFQDGKRRNWFPEAASGFCEDSSDPGFYLNLRMGNCTQAINELGRQLDYYHKQAHMLDRLAAR